MDTCSNTERVIDVLRDIICSIWILPERAISTWIPDGPRTIGEPSMRRPHSFELKNLDALKDGVLSVSKTEPRIFLQRFGACRSSAPHAFCVYGLGVSLLAVRFSFGF